MENLGRACSNANSIILNYTFSNIIKNIQFFREIQALHGSKKEKLLVIPR